MRLARPRITQMVVNDRRISRIMAAQSIRVIRCIFRSIREMLVYIEIIRLIREIRG